MAADWRQECQMFFQIKNHHLGKFWKALERKNGYILWEFGMFYGHLEYFITIWYILCSFGTLFSSFGIADQEKSGNPDRREKGKVAIF
jgi:hypothetical protein